MLHVYPISVWFVDQNGIIFSNEQTLILEACSVKDLVFALSQLIVDAIINSLQLRLSLPSRNDN
jgi:hypothetical protein